MFDFELTSEQLSVIGALDIGVRGGPEPADTRLDDFEREIPEV